LAALEEEQKKAELTAKMDTLTKRHSLEQEKAKLKLAEENLELLAEIAISDAKAQVIRKYQEQEPFDIESDFELTPDKVNPLPTRSEGNSFAMVTHENSDGHLGNGDTIKICDNGAMSKHVTPPSSIGLVVNCAMHALSTPVNPPPSGTATFSPGVSKVLKFENCEGTQFNEVNPLPTGGKHAESTNEKPLRENDVGNLVARNNATPPQSLNPSVPDFKPNSCEIHQTEMGLESVVHQLNASQLNQERLTQLIIEQQQRHLLPQSDVPKFGGDPMEYRPFIRAFDSQVASRTAMDSERLHYLEQYTTGRPKEMVRSCMHLNPNRGYEAARSLLQDKYGNEYNIAIAYVNKALGWPQIKPEDVEGLDKFAVFLTGCQYAMEDIQFTKEIEHPSNMAKIAEKLPYFLQDRWSRKAHDIMGKRNGQVEFSSLAKFVRDEANVASNPIFGRKARRDRENKTTQNSKGKEEKHSKSVPRRSNFATNATASAAPTWTQGQRSIIAKDKQSLPIAQDQTRNSQDGFSRPCLFCGGNHMLEECRKLRYKQHTDKISFLKSKGLCFACLSHGHLSSDCRNRISCKVCKETHPAGLHRQNDASQTQVENKDAAPKPQATVNRIGNRDVGHVTGAGSDPHIGTMAVLPVKVKVKDREEMIATYAFLDTGSSATFISEGLRKQLRITGRKTKLNLSTMGAKDQMVGSEVISGLEVYDLNEDNGISLPNVYTQPELPVTQDEIPMQQDVDRWPHLSGVHIPRIKADVGILIGNNVPNAMEPWQVINSRGNGPYAVKTLLGWAVNGPLKQTNPDAQGKSRQVVNSITGTCDLDEQLRSHFNQDFSERSPIGGTEYSREDRQFLKDMEASLVFEDGHYQMDLPLKDKHVQMLSNKTQALQRGSQLKRKFDQNRKFYEDYRTFMDNLIEKGYAEKVPSQEIIGKDGRTWYIPHHGVYHP
jgi:hypothetical protein